MSGSAVHVSDSVRLRRWQHAALDRFVNNDQADFLAVAMSSWHEPVPDEWSIDDLVIEVKLGPLPTYAAPIASVDGHTRRQTKDALRGANAAAARDLARRTGLTHAQVNAELNRQVGLRRITEATVTELETRLEHAERWLARTV